jgi:hypothetical protein
MVCFSMGKKWIVIGIVTAIAIFILIVFYFAYIYSPETEIYDKSPLETDPEAVIIRNGTFNATTHNVKGKVLLIKSEDKLILRMEDFESDGGPDVFIYLSPDRDVDDIVNLGKMRATKGDINYNVPSDTDIDKYNHVLVYCVPYTVIFGYAELS